MPNYYVDHLLCMPADQWPDSFNRAMGKTNKKIYVLIQGPSEMGATGDCKITNWDRSTDLSKIEVFMLVIGACHDTMDPEHMRWMSAQFPHSQYLDCPNGSHMALYDDQQTWFNGLIKFLNN